MSVSSSSQEFLSRKQVAALLHVSAASVTRWARASRLPYVQTLGGHRRYPAAVVIHLAEDLDRRGTDAPRQGMRDAVLQASSGEHLHLIPPTDPTGSFAASSSRWREGDVPSRIAGKCSAPREEEE